MRTDHGWEGGELTVGRGGVQDVKVSETVRLCYCCPLEGRVRPHPTLPIFFVQILAGAVI